MTAAAETCHETGKLRYATHAHAFVIAKRTSRSNKLRTKQPPKGSQCHAYRCEFCTGFHVGHASPSKARRR